MKVTVWDTYVTKKDGSIMHFDIIAPDTINDEDVIHAVLTILNFSKINEEFLKKVIHHLHENSDA